MKRHISRARLAVTAALGVVLIVAVTAVAAPPPGKGNGNGNGNGNGKGNGKAAAPVAPAPAASAAQSQYGPGGKQYGKNKVAICHKGHTIRVAQPAVKAHLKHGDRLGTC
jgi:hypothetical protein